MKVAFFEVEKWEKNLIKSRLKKHSQEVEGELFEVALTEETVDLARGFDAVSVFIYSRVTKEVMDSLPNLKIVATRSTGFDHIDTKHARKKRIAVANVPHYGENTVAEHTFALILDLSRNIHKAYMRVQFGKFSIEGLQGFDLKGKILGVVGTGHIGLHVIKIAKGFGMNVLAYDVKPNHFMAEFLGFEYVSFEELLRRSDIVSLHVPLLPSTKHMINKNNIHLFKKGALLINTSRGGLVETEALLMALEKKILAGAGLDVFEGERIVIEDAGVLSSNYPLEELRALILNSKLFHMDNVVITPHIAFFSREAVARIIDTTFENLVSFAEKGEPVFPVK